MTRAARFSQADVERALRAAEKRGLGIAGYEITPDGTIRILTERGERIEDDWRAKLGLRHAAS